jgi:hypothetical protein
MARKSQSEVVTEEERELVRALVYDTLLGSVPLVLCNVREALEKLLVNLGRPKLAEVARTV